MQIPFRLLTPANGDDEWIACISDMSHPVIGVFSYADLNRFQGVEHHGEGLDEPFIYHFSRVSKNAGVSGTLQNNANILKAMLRRISQDRDAASWVMLQALFKLRIVGNDRNAWKLIEQLTLEEILAVVSPLYSHWGDPQLHQLSEATISAAFQKLCEISGQVGMEAFDFLPTNRSLFASGKVCQSNGVPGESSYVIDAVPAITFAKGYLQLLPEGVLCDRTLSHMQRCASGLPIPSWAWEQKLKEIVDVNDQSLSLPGRLEQLGGVITWEDMCNHQWNKLTPISFHDMAFMYDLQALGEIEATKEERRSLMEMIRLLYGKLRIGGWSVEDVLQMNIDLKDLFNALPSEPGEGLGVDMFWGSDSPKSVIDEWIDTNEDKITGAIIGKFSGYDSNIPIAANRLLGIIMCHASIERPEHWFQYSMVKIGLMARKRAEQLGVTGSSLGLKDLLEKGSFGNYTRDYTPPFPTETQMIALYDEMPEWLKESGAKLFLGLALTREELKKVTPAQRDQAFEADMGL